MQGLDGKEPGDLLAMLVDVLQQETIAPDAEPGVDAARSQRSLLGIEFAKWLLHSEEALFARMWHGTSQVEHPAATIRRRRVVICPSHLFASTVTTRYRFTYSLLFSSIPRRTGFSTLRITYAMILFSRTFRQIHFCQI